MLLAASEVSTRDLLIVGEETIDLGTLRVRSRPEQPRLTPKAADVLAVLAAHPGQTLSRAELLDRVWPDTCPTPDVLTQAIAELRRTLGDDQRAPRLIETVPKRGYRLIAPVRWDRAAPVTAASDGVTGHDVPALAPASAHVRGAHVSPSNARGRRIAIVAVALAAAAGAVLATGYALRRVHSPAVEGAVRTVVPRPAPRMLTRAPGRETLPQLSNDGTQVIYSVGHGELETSGLMMQGVDSPEAIPIAGADGRSEIDAKWSPDGRLIAFQSFDENGCEIRLRPVLGGTERTIAPCEWEVLSLFDWLPDGSGVITSSLRGADPAGIRLMLHPIDGAARPLDYPRAPPDHDLNPRYSPDGRQLAFRRGRNPYSDLYLLDPTQPSSLRRLTRLNTIIDGFDWLPDGRALIAALDHEGPLQLYRIDVDSGAITALGIAPAVRPDVARHRATVVYEVPRQVWHIARLEPDGAGIRARTLMSSTATDAYPIMAPDGRRLVFISDRTGDWQVWLHDIARERSVPLTDLRGARPRFPDWHPDGASVAFIAQLSTLPQAFRLQIDSGQLSLLSPPEFAVARVVHAPDGGLLLIGAYGGAEGLFLVDAAGDWRLRAAGVRHARMDARTGEIYVNYHDRPGIFRLAADGTPVPLPLQAAERREIAWLIEGTRIVYQAMRYGGDELRAFDLATQQDVLLSETLLPAFNKGVTAPDVNGHRYTTFIASDTSDLALFDLEPDPLASSPAPVAPYAPAAPAPLMSSL